MRRFPILKPTGVVKSIPWEWMEPYRQMVMRNHGQSLEQVASRGGLSEAEIMFCAMGKTWTEWMLWSNRSETKP